MSLSLYCNFFHISFSLFISFKHSPWFGVYACFAHTKSRNDSQKICRKWQSRENDETRFGIPRSSISLNDLRPASRAGCLTPSYEPLIPGMPSRPGRLIDSQICTSCESSTAECPKADIETKVGETLNCHDFHKLWLLSLCKPLILGRYSGVTSPYMVSFLRPI